MKDAVDPSNVMQQRKARAVSAMLGLSLLIGITATAQAQSTSAGLAVFLLLLQVAPLMAGFVWLHYDSAEIGYQRSPALNIGIVMAAIVFVPVYFFKTRAPGARAALIKGFFLLILACIGLSGVGAWAMVSLNPVAPADHQAAP